MKAGGDAGALFESVLAALSHALYIAGELDEATECARAAAEHPDVPQLQPWHAVALSVLALTTAQQGRVASARVHLTAPRRSFARPVSATGWVGGVVAAASAVVHREEGNLPQAEREAETAERIRRTQGASVELAWTLGVAGRHPPPPGRLVEADSTLEETRDLLGELADAGRLEASLAAQEQELADALESAAAGDLSESPSEAELAVLRLLAGDLSVRQIAAELYLSVNTVKSHTRSLYRKLGVSTRARRSRGQARSGSSANHPG